MPPMLDARAMPRMRDLEKADLEGRVRRIGCRVRVSSIHPCKRRTHLDERVAKHRRRDVTDPHARKARDAHVRQEDRLGLGSREAEDLGREDFVDVLLAESRCEREATEEEHDGRAEHLAKDVPAFGGQRLGEREREENGLGRFACCESTIFAVGRPNDAENDDEEGNHQRRDKQRHDLRSLVSSARSQSTRKANSPPTPKRW